MKMELATTSHVIARDSFGRFRRNIEQAAGETVRELVEEGMNISREMAPVGHKHDRRTTPLRDSMFMVMESSTKGYWGNFARHALAVEHGSRPHIIPGNPNLGFWWEKQGRMWIPAETFYGVPGMQDFVNHPGADAQPFLKPAYDVIRDRMMSKLRAKMSRM